MKLIIQSLYQKRIFQYSILIVIFVLTILSMQISATITLKNETMIDQMNAIQAPHTTIYTAGNDQRTIYTLEKYLSTFNETNEIDLIAHYEHNYFLTAIEKGIDEKEIPSQYCVLEGYLNEGGRNRYHVVKGKALDQLKGNEIAVNERYAKSLSDDFDDVIGKQLERIAVSGGEAQDADYQIVSIFEDPRTGVLSEKDQDTLKLFEASNEELSDHDYWGFINYDTAKVHQVETNVRIREIHEGDKITEIEEPYEMYHETFQLYYQNYSMEDEATLLTLYTYNVDGGSFISFQPFYTLLMQESMSQSIFRFLSYTLLAALLIADFFIFYAFLKRQLDEDKEKLALMNISGVKRKQIIYAYLFEILVLMGIAVSIMAVIDMVCAWIGVDKMPYLSTFYQMTPRIAGITLAGAVGVSLLLMVVTIITLCSFLKQDMIHSLKEKDLTIQRHVHRRISFRHQLSAFAWRDLIASKWKLMRTTLASTFLILCLLLTYHAYQSLANLYNETTVGIHFDYTIGGLNEAQYAALQENYAKDISYLSAENKYYKEKVGEIDDINVYLYYPAKLMRIYDDMAPFVDLHAGTYPSKAEMFIIEYVWYYKDMQVVLSRRIMDMKGAAFADEHDIVSGINEGTLSYDDIPYGYYANGGNSVYIKGNTDSLLNNGYSSFSIFRNEDGIEPYILAENDVTRDLSGGTIVNLKEGVAHQDFEQWLKQEGISYVPYAAMLEQLNETNAKVQEKTFSIMVAVMSLMVLLLVILIGANIAEDHMHKKKQLYFMQAVGYSAYFIRSWNWVRVMLSLLLSFVCALVLYVPIKWLFFMLLARAVGVYELAGYGYLAFIAVFVLMIVGALWIIVQNHRMKHYYHAKG